MKRIRCPKCDGFIPFDDTRYEDGQRLVFVCPDCKKEFAIRLKKNAPSGAEEREADLPHEVLGKVVVVENVFAYRQEFPLKEGSNLIGRRSKGTITDIRVETNDPSMDRVHCNLKVERNKRGEVRYVLQDCNSNTGTFVMNRLLGDREQCRLDDGDVITLGATTLILHADGVG